MDNLAKIDPTRFNFIKSLYNTAAQQDAEYKRYIASQLRNAATQIERDGIRIYGLDLRKA